MFSQIDHTSINIEIQLIESMKLTDEAAWETAFERCSRKLFDDIVSSLRKRGMDPSFANDIQQEVWLTAVEKIGDFVPETDQSFYYWLRAISLNHVRNWLRKHRADTTLETVEEDTGVPLEVYLYRYELFTDSPEKSILINEQITALLQLLENLKPRDRDIILRRFLLEQSPREIAQVWPALKPRSISQLLNRLLKSIRIEHSIIQAMHVDV